MTKQWERIRKLEFARQAYLDQFPEDDRAVRSEHWSECTDEGAELDRLLENEDSAQEERSYYDDGADDYGPEGLNGRFEDSPRYRADMIAAGRGRLVR